MWMLHYIVEQVDIKKPIVFQGSMQLSNIWGHPNMELHITFPFDFQGVYTCPQL